MRVLIFFGMLFLFEAFKLFLGKNGFRIGGFLPTFVFIGAELYVSDLVAKNVSRKMEMKKLIKKAKEQNVTPYEYVSNRIPKVFWDEIESKIDKPELLGGYLYALEKDKVITYSESEIIRAFSRSIIG